MTVTLAAVVFVVINMGGNTPDAPTVSFHQDRTAKRLTVVAAPPADWYDVTPTFTAPCTAQLEHRGSTTSWTSGERATPVPTKINGGDAIILSGPAGTECSIALSHSPSNQSMGSWTFTT